MSNLCARNLTCLTVLIGTLGLLAGPVRAELKLDPATRDGYRLWLHNLEMTLANAEPGTTGEAPLYPFGVIDGRTASRADTTSLVGVARELNEIEELPRILQEPARKTALYAITRARNHAHVAEFDTALAWYEEAARRDSLGAFRRDLGPETIAVALASGDSLAATRSVLSLFGGRDLSDRTTELTLAYRHFVSHADTANLDLLIAEVEQHVDLNAADGRLVFWHAFALNWRHRWEPSLDLLGTLLRRGGHSQGLTVPQRTWVLVAVADQLVVTEHLQEAEALYRALAETALTGAREWARCQVAVMDFLAGRYLEAGTAFEELCDQRESHPWRAYACGMSQVSDEMTRLKKEGQDNGAVAHYEH